MSSDSEWKKSRASGDNARTPGGVSNWTTMSGSVHFSLLGMIHSQKQNEYLNHTPNFRNDAREFAGVLWKYVDTYKPLFRVSRLRLRPSARRSTPKLDMC
jgi:hypothetical protein